MRLEFWTFSKTFYQLKKYNHNIKYFKKHKNFIPTKINILTENKTKENCYDRNPTVSLRTITESL